MKESVTYQKILEKGRREGETLGEAHALLKILAARGFAVSKKLRQRVLACQDLALLDRWLTQAVTAGSIQEMFPD